MEMIEATIIPTAKNERSLTRNANGLKTYMQDFEL